MKISLKPKSPVEFLEVAKTPRDIQAYYQETLGPKLTSSSESGSLLAERVLYHLHRYVPRRIEKLRRQYFVPGMPANVALMCAISEIRQHRFIGIDPIELCEDVPEAIELNRILAMALEYNSILSGEPEFSFLRGAYPVEVIGLMEMTRRNLVRFNSSGVGKTPLSEIDLEFAELIHEFIHY